MDKFRALFIIIIMYTVIIGCKSDNEINVILVGGQSNATGQGYIKNLPVDFVVDTSVLFYYSKYIRGSGSPEEWQPLTNASESADKFGPELGLGNQMAKLYPNKKFAVIKHALSGSNLFKQWNPGSSNGDSLHFGPEYKKFISTVSEGISKLEAKGLKSKIIAMTWQQGEADARDNVGLEVSNAYEKNLTHFIKRVREQFSVPEMLFVYGYVIPVPLARFTGRDEVRLAQKNIDANSNNEAAVKGAFVVESDDLPLRNTEPSSPYPDDVVHFNTYGMLELGKRYAIKISNNL